MQQIKERGALPMIDRGDIRQAIDRCSNIWASPPGAGYVRLEHKADSLIAKFKEAGGTVRESMYEHESPRLSPLWLSASSSACHGLLIITVITPLPTKPSATKMPENPEAGERRITDMMRQRDVAALDAKYTKELADAKAENDALRDDVAAGRRRLHISKQLRQSVRSCFAASGVDNAAPRLADTAESGLFPTLRERLITMQNNWKEPRSILMSSVDRVAHIDGQLMQLL